MPCAALQPTSKPAEEILDLPMILKQPRTGEKTSEPEYLAVRMRSQVRGKDDYEQ